MIKRSVLLFCSILIFVLLIFNVLAQIPSGLDTEALENDSVVKGVKELERFTQEKRWEYLGEKWKEILLKNKVIFAVDKFFTKINIVFVILFGRDWTFSLGMFLVFLIWFYVLILSYHHFEFVFWENELFRLIGGFGVTIILAQLGLYNFISQKVMDIAFKDWSLLTKVLVYLAVLVAFFAVAYANRLADKAMKESKEKEEKHKLKHKVETQEEFQEGLEKGL